jgi:hypothetical protein
VRDLSYGRGHADMPRGYERQAVVGSGNRDGEDRAPYDHLRGTKPMVYPSRGDAGRDDGGLISRWPPGFMDRRDPRGGGVGERGRDLSPPRGESRGGGSGNAPNDKVSSRNGLG